MSNNTINIFDSTANLKYSTTKIETNALIRIKLKQNTTKNILHLVNLSYLNICIENNHIKKPNYFSLKQDQFEINLLMFFDQYTKLYSTNCHMLTMEQQVEMMQLNNKNNKQSIHYNKELKNNLLLMMHNQYLEEYKKMIFQLRIKISLHLVIIEEKK